MPARRRRVGALVLLLLILAGCGPRMRPLHGAAPTTTPGTDATTTPATITTTTATTRTTTTRRPPATSTTVIAPDVAALPPGGGARLAIVIDDVGGADTYLADYLRLSVPLTFGVMPLASNATAADQKIVTAGREALLHIPLPVSPNRDAPGGLGLDATEDDVSRYLDTAKARVPDSDGANNHTGSWGTATPQLMDRLLRALASRGMFFMDSVTSQQTVGYATELALGMPSRINNLFLDTTESSARAQLLQLARLAAAEGTAIGIGHVTRTWVLHLLQTLAPQLQVKGYRFAFLRDVTNRAVGPLDAGVRSTL